MDIVLQLQELDNLILTETKPPATTVLRSKLATITEQAEAYQASADKQDETLATQIKTIERLMKENQDLITQQKNRELKASEGMRKLAAEEMELHLKRQLKG